MGILDVPGTSVARAARIARPRNRVVLLGDSFWERNGGPRLAPANLVTFDSQGPFVWCNYFLGQAFRVIKNAGVGGQQMGAFLARVPADVDAYDPDWVIGTGGINDVNAGRSAAQIIADFTALFNYLVNMQGYRVTWNTINTVSTGWTNPQFVVQNTVNQWLRQEAPSLWPSLIVIDAYNAVFNVAAAGIPVAYRTDATHLGPAGAIRVGKAMADALRAFAPNGFLLAQPSSGSQSPNLLSNGRFASPSSGVAAGWTGAGSNVTHSQVARTDEPEGFWQRMEITANGSATVSIANVALDPTKITPGTDGIRLVVECQVTGLDLLTPTALTQRFNARMQIYDVSNVLLADFSAVYADGGITYANLLMQPGRGLLATPEVPVPATATKVTVSLSAAGTGRFEWDKATLAKVLNPAY